MDQLATSTSVVGGRDSSALSRKGILKERLMHLTFATKQVAISCSLHCSLYLALRNRQQAWVPYIPQETRDGVMNPRVMWVESIHRVKESWNYVVSLVVRYYFSMSRVYLF